MSYDNQIGYSPLECVDRKKLRRVIRINKAIMDGYYSARSNDLLLVAGAGQGDEAVLLQREYGLRTVGVDINIIPTDAPGTAADLALQVQDLSALAFKDDSFALIYSYHVLEHVADPAVVLHELHRVLKPEGILFIGFPNKRRLLSYIGTSQKATWIEKMRWNANDYVYRIRGRFENRFGAHAGFSDREFRESAVGIFTAVHPVRSRYMLSKYPGINWAIRFLVRTGLDEFAFPSNYYVCAKGRLPETATTQTGLTGN